MILSEKRDKMSLKNQEKCVITIISTKRKRGNIHVEMSKMWKRI